MRLVERNHYFLAMKNFPIAMLLALPFWTVWRYALMAYAVLRGKGKGQAAGSEKMSALLGAFFAGHWEALIGSVRQWRNRPKTKRITASAFRKKLKEHRVSLGTIFFSE